MDDKIKCGTFRDIDAILDEVRANRRALTVDGWAAIESIKRLRESYQLHRCDYCGWPLVEDAGQGCVDGMCSMRPRPQPDADVVMNKEATRRLIRFAVAALERQAEETK